MKKIAIIGAGNSGCAHAVKLAKRGHSVRLLKTSNTMHNENFDLIERTRKIEYIDSTENEEHGFVELDLVSKDLEQGLKDVDVVMVLTQSLQHRDLAPRISKYLKKGAIVFIIPGNLGSAVFAKYVNTDDVILVEGESTPYDARIEKPGCVRILFKNARNAISFYNKAHVRYLPVIDSLFGRHKFLRNNIIETALHNPNLVVHTIGVIMSVGRIENSGGTFCMYKEAFSDSVWNLISALDVEKNQVIEAFGGEALNYLDVAKWRNEEDLSMDSLAVFRSYAKDAPVGPTSLDTRYIYEDVPMGLCLLENLGRLKNIATPITTSLINIANSLKQTDYREIAYKMEEIKLPMI